MGGAHKKKPVSPYQKSDAYKDYSAFGYRPKGLSIWPRNSEGKFVIQPGELFCRYEANGKICGENKRFKCSGDLTSHVTNRHDRNAVEKVGRPAGQEQHRALIAFYSGLVDTMRNGPSYADPIAIGDDEPPLTRIKPEDATIIADDNEILEDDSENDEDADESDDEDDGIANIPVPIVKASSGTMTMTLAYTKDTLGLRIIQAQKMAKENRLL